MFSKKIKMQDSLIEDLLKIVAQGKKQEQKILDNTSARNHVTLRNNGDNLLAMQVACERYYF